MLNKENDILLKVTNETRYIPWWDLSDKFPWHMARLICNASKLKSDDMRFKGMSQSHRVCK